MTGDLLMLKKKIRGLDGHKDDDLKKRNGDRVNDTDWDFLIKFGGILNPKLARQEQKQVVPSCSSLIHRAV